VIAFETSVCIERPIEEFFDYVSDLGSFPLWNSAVQDVRPLSSNDDSERSRYVIERDLPSGPALNELEIVARDVPTEFVVRTISGPTPFLYRYRFTGENGETVVRLDAKVELAGIASVLAPVVRRVVKGGVDANFRAVKRILEARS
jgi:uncharacterized membrane protein